MISTRHLITGACLALLVAAVGGCGDDDDPIVTDKACSSNSECGTGQYCGADKKCTSDCTKNTDCLGGGTCSSIGKCIGGSQDAGVDQPQTTPDQAVQLDNSVIIPDRAVVLPDVMPWLDTMPTPDTRSWLDITPAPDRGPLADVTIIQDRGQINDVTVGDTIVLPDAVTPTCNEPELGKPCDDDNDCSGGNFCIPFYSDRKGVCTCICTLGQEDSCPGSPANTCVDFTDAGAGLCFETCEPKLGASDCQGTAGTDLIGCDGIGTSTVLGVYDKAVCFYGGCQQNSDCGVAGGDCTVGGAACPQVNSADGQCLANEEGSTEGTCIYSGVCNLASGLCEDHTLGNQSAQIGDPCTSDLECAGNMTCLTEGGTDPVLWRNGYCSVWGCEWGGTQTNLACPTGSTCNLFYVAGLCQKDCSMDDATPSTSCRNNGGNDRWGDYECRAWNEVPFTSPVTDKPTCDFGPLYDCRTLAEFIGISCAMFAPVANTTNMTCRLLDGTIPTFDPQDINAYPTDGYCFDNTAASSTLP